MMKAYTRRQLMTGGTMALAGLASAQTQEAPGGPSEPKNIVPARAIHQEEDYKSSPQKIYEALLDAKQFSAMTGVPGAEIQPVVGGRFTIFAGHIMGFTVELVPNRRIVQAWRVVTWPEGIYSIAKFDLALRNTGTRVTFDHTGFPSELAEHLESGWREHYWGPLQKYLG
jgi:activator of HSP90 ATPase